MDEIVIDLPGGKLTLDVEEARGIRDAAAAEAGRSTTARDISLLLDRALSEGSVVALRRNEAHTLLELARTAGFGKVAVMVAAITDAG
jgi:hypothetical protein